jgi:uncharacterized membrane protein
MPRIRRVRPDAARHWLEAGWQDFRDHLWVSLGYASVVLGLVCLALWASWEAPQFVLSFATGLLLLGPFLATGCSEISRRAQAGEPVTAWPVFMAWRRNAMGFVLFAALLGLLMLAWVRFTSVLGALMFLGAGTTGFELGLTALFTSAEGLRFVAVFVVSGGLLAALVFALSVAALPMLLDPRYDVAQAVATSLAAVRANGRTMLVWATTVVAATGIGLATGLVGMLVIFPVIGHATWHAYRALVDAER